MMKKSPHKFWIGLIGLGVMSSALAAVTPLLIAKIKQTSTDSVQQLTLPAQVIVHSQQTDLRDIQIIDAQQKPLAMAWLAPNTTQAQNQYTLKTYPILGQANNNNNDKQNVSLRISQKNDEPVIEVNSHSNSGTQPNQIIGVLLDTRDIPAEQTAVALKLNAQMPTGKIIPLNITSSEHLNDTLTDWRTVSDNASLAQFTNADTRIEQNTINLPAISLNHHYLRITWEANESLRIDSATLTTQSQATPNNTPEAINLGLPESFTAQHERNSLTWQLPHAIAAQSLSIQTQTNGLTPIRIYTRTQAQSPWQEVSGGAVFQISHNGQTRHNDTFPIDNTLQALRIETDKGLALPADIRIALMVAPRTLAFVGNGNTPYSLALNQNSEQSLPNLSLSTLIPNYTHGDEYTLPVATLDALNLPPFTAQTAQESRTPYLLWGILIVGIIALSLMVLVIWRQMKHPTQ